MFDCRCCPLPHLIAMGDRNRNCPPPLSERERRLHLRADWGPLESRGRGGVRRPLFEREAPDQFETETLKTGPSLSRRYWLQPYYCPSVVVCLKWKGWGAFRGRDFCLWLSRRKKRVDLSNGRTAATFPLWTVASAAESRRPSISLSIKADCRDWRMS